MSNRLARSTSPYLRQHADNPVDWWEWGPEPFAEARRRDVPVLVSIGYSTCHWCHVMAAESFSDADIAAQMNAGFVSIKVDREELPAVDAHYMDAHQAVRGSGGWPLTVVVDHEGRPFFAGTYYPPAPRAGTPSFPQVLATVSGLWHDERPRVDAIARELGQALADMGRKVDGAMDGRDATPTPSAPEVPHTPGTSEAGTSAAGPLDADLLDRAVAQLSREADHEWGGFGTAPKFPPLLTVLQLTRHAARTGEHGALDLVRTTLTRIATGGIRDQLAGGIARYAVDREWTVPHFEKMLYDNALYLRAVTAWYRLESAMAQTTSAVLPGRFAALARREAADTVAFLDSDLRLPDGAFAAGLDADAPVAPDSPQAATHGAGAHVEGAHCTFTRDQVTAAFEAARSTEGGIDDLGSIDRLRTVDDLLLGLEGDVEGAQVLTRPDVLRWLESSGGTPAPWDSPRAQAQVSALRKARATRPVPHRDTKVVTEWNALAVTALAEAAAVFDRADWAALAEQAFAPLVRWLPDLPRSYEGVRRGPAAAGLVDWAQTTRAALALAQVPDGLRRGHATGCDPMRVATEGVRVITDRFVRLTTDGLRVVDAVDPVVGVERTDPIDGVTPSGRTAAAEALLLHAELADPVTASANGAAGAGTDPRDLAFRLLRGYRDIVAGSPRGAGWALHLAEEWAAGPLRVDTADPALAAVAAAHPAVFALASTGASGAVVCRGTECSLPVHSSQALRAELDRFTTRIT
ncbi:thioredoxin domain-containing protein [Brevibacterium litoralis]|uniref:thioredoxin domain-containing protein n=1 Tax=Brevibacterium litoralis TaxID=3138935 RepID=UPI0032EB3150